MLQSWSYQFFSGYMYTFTEPYRFTVEVAFIHISCYESFSEVLKIYVYIQSIVKITATETEFYKNDQISLQLI